jgi:hypothetical protein
MVEMFDNPAHVEQMPNRREKEKKTMVIRD